MRGRPLVKEGKALGHSTHVTVYSRTVLNREQRDGLPGTLDEVHRPDRVGVAFIRDSHDPAGILAQQANGIIGGRTRRQIEKHPGAGAVAGANKGLRFVRPP